MKIRNCWLVTKYLMITMILSQGISFSALAHEGEAEPGSTSATPAPKIPKPPSCQILTADRLFDGVDLHLDWAVLIKKDKVFAVGPQAQIKRAYCKKNKLGNATIMPGFIESHAHITFQDVRKDTVLKHGITTVQDTGGPIMTPEGGQGTLRLLSVGPIIQAEDGYPLNIFTKDGIGGYDKIGYPISPDATQTEVEEVVQHLVDDGATAIKIALEPGGEAGAPWMMPHDGPVPSAPWKILSLDQVKWITAKAHGLVKPVRVIAHVGEQTGFDRAVAGGVDELGHMPCAPISESSLQAAVDADITFVTTINTLSSCGEAIHQNTFKLASKGAKFIYGSEIGHDNVPWGINGEELHMMLHLTSGDSVDFADVTNVIKAATSKAGERLGIPGLGTLAKDAPADIIAVKGNPFEKFKLLEYPDLVMSGGRVIVNNFK